MRRIRRHTPTIDRRALYHPRARRAQMLLSQLFGWVGTEGFLEQNDLDAVEVLAALLRAMVAEHVAICRRIESGTLPASR